MGYHTIRGKSIDGNWGKYEEEKKRKERRARERGEEKEEQGKKKRVAGEERHRLGARISPPPSTVLR